jgi:hypothetical protein
VLKRTIKGVYRTFEMKFCCSSRSKEELLKYFHVISRFKFSSLGGIFGLQESRSAVKSCFYQDDKLSYRRVVA